MFFNLAVEISVALLLAVTIGYCVVLNSRLKRLHADRAALSQIISDLVGATDLANQAIKDLKEVARDTDVTLGKRLEEAESFAIELANHVTSGQSVLDRIARITEATRPVKTSAPKPEAAPAATPKAKASYAQSALERLRTHQQSKGNAA